MAQAILDYLFIMIPTFVMPRVYLPQETLASIYADDNSLICKTLELPWLNNRQNKSCIPEDTYVVIKMNPGFGRSYSYFRLAYVKDRNMNTGVNMSTILIHPASKVEHLLGCIGVGSRFEDLNKDGIPDLVGSTPKLQWMVDNLPDAFFLKITKKV